MNRLQLVLHLSGALARRRAAFAYQGHVLRDPEALLHSRRGSDDPYRLHERVRASGRPVRSRRGHWISAHHDVCEEVLRDGTVDLVGTFAAALPSAVLVHLLGIPDDHAARFVRSGAVIGSGIDGIHSLAHARKLASATAEIEGIFTELLDRGRDSPGADVISVLASARAEAAIPRELLSLCTMLLVAGFETTINLITNAVDALLDHPHQWDALCADPAGLADGVVEEVLRFDPPVQRAGRAVPFDLEVAGCRVERGDYIVALIGGANRDPAAHPDPATFDVLRPTRAENLAFSHGIHYCLGKPLVRLEAAVALRKLAERLPHLRAAGRARRRTSSLVRGFTRYPVAV